MGPDTTLDVNDVIDAMNEVATAAEEFFALMAKLAERTCGPVRANHDVAYCIHCEGGFCRRCGRADAWYIQCAHEPAWPHDI